LPEPYQKCYFALLGWHCNTHCNISRIIAARVQIPALRPKEMSNRRLARPAKTVHRIYGGHLSHAVVKDRIVRAFLIEEQKIIKKVRGSIWSAGSKSCSSYERRPANLC